MNKVIRSNAREILDKVFMRCTPYQAEKLPTNLEDVYNRTADFTGVSESTVRRIAKQGIKTEGKLSIARHSDLRC